MADDYIKKVNDIVEDGIKQMKYIETTDDTCNQLKRFQDFLYRHFYKHEHYEEMRPKSNQPGRFFATLRRINLNLSVILLYSNSSYAPLLTKMALISTKLRKL